jgi:pimeloyl-ACP methyl ester carboxylesterase
VKESERRRIFETLVPDSGRVARDFTLAGVAVDESKVHCPVLCVVGKEDNAEPARSVRRVASKYGAELREYAGRGHWLHEEPGFDDMAREIVSWLEQHAL